MALSGNCCPLVRGRGWAKALVEAQQAGQPCSFEELEVSGYVLVHDFSDGCLSQAREWRCQSSMTQATTPTDSLPLLPPPRAPAGLPAACPLPPAPSLPATLNLPCLPATRRPRCCTARSCRAC